MGLIGKLGGSLTQGVLGNMSEVSVEELAKEYGAYLMDNETIQLGFRLVRDVVLFTDKRIVDFDKQGATGQKIRMVYPWERKHLSSLKNTTFSLCTKNFKKSHTRTTKI